MYKKNNYRRVSKRRTARKIRKVVLVVIALLAVAAFITIRAFAEDPSKADVTNAQTNSNTVNTTTNYKEEDAQQLSLTNEIPEETETVTTPVDVEPAGTAIVDEEEEEEIPQIYEGTFELPIQGATAYASVTTEFFAKDGTVLFEIAPGTSLEIIEDNGSLWTVRTADGTVGMVDNLRMMINLPDVLPSVVYMDTNSDSSVFTSSGEALPGVTGEQLYNVRQFNNRLGREEYNMAILYSTAKKIAEVQKTALSDGYSLCIVETYRPMETQQKVCDSLKELANSNAKVQDGITGGGWSESWFIAQSVSNHQRGYAMDVTLVEVTDMEICVSGDYAYNNVSGWNKVNMPTEIHELSDASVALKHGVKSSSTTAWKTVGLADTMNDEAIRLQNYCVDAGFTPLASEWWHFNDNTTREAIGANASTGEYFLAENISVIPE